MNEKKYKVDGAYIQLNLAPGRLDIAECDSNEVAHKLTLAANFHDELVKMLSEEIPHRKILYDACWKALSMINRCNCGVTCTGQCCHSLLNKAMDHEDSMGNAEQLLAEIGKEKI